ncbi:hypothetical protein LINGRAHAP2_LOCUS5740 [Linum grandiflorum]
MRVLEQMSDSVVKSQDLEILVSTVDSLYVSSQADLKKLALHLEEFFPDESKCSLNKEVEDYGEIPDSGNLREVDHRIARFCQLPIVAKHLSKSSNPVINFTEISTVRNFSIIFHFFV